MLHSLKYTNDGVPEGSAGVARGWMIRIRPQYKNDEGLLQHELCHVRQFWVRGPFFHSLRYLWSQAYRLRCEVEAYREQLRFPPASGRDEYRLLYTDFIVNNYGLDVSRQDVARMMEG